VTPPAISVCIVGLRAPPLPSFPPVTPAPVRVHLNRVFHPPPPPVRAHLNSLLHSSSCPRLLQSSAAPPLLSAPTLYVCHTPSSCPRSPQPPVISLPAIVYPALPSCLTFLSCGVRTARSLSTLPLCDTYSPRRFNPNLLSIDQMFYVIKSPRHQPASDPAHLPAPPMSEPAASTHPCPTDPPDLLSNFAPHRCHAGIKSQLHLTT